MSALRLMATERESKAVVGRIGGTPRLPAGTEWPRCALCREELIAFLQIRLPALPEMPFQPGGRLQVFACRQHDDIPGPIYSDYTAFAEASQRRQLPPEYWEMTDGHYLLRLLPASVETTVSHREKRLAPQWIAAQRLADESADGFKLFGEPFWQQDPEVHSCSCGAPMKLILQLPEHFGFSMAQNAPQQSNSSYADQYVLFLGNQLYLLACSEQCHTSALWPVLQ
jgi:hypothetical protein